MSGQVEWVVRIHWPRDPVPEVVWLIKGDDAPDADDAEAIQETANAAAHEADHYRKNDARRVEVLRRAVGEWEPA